ncbi:PH domain-containing protein [Candidatus Sumerlaeota bacterium]|nr:PH domain-containing protein [Candidatus Sumerlaeota bacterium]
MPEHEIDESAIYAIARPHPNLLIQYFLWSLSTIIPISFIPLFLKYYTLRYRFDSQGVSMSWGFFFRQEIHLTYARIQDIHLSRGVIERWLGIGTLAIQTASGSAGAEMTIPGLTQYEAVRDFLYQRMRGHHRADTPTRASALSETVPASVSAQDRDEAVSLLREIRADLRAIRQATSSFDGSSNPGGAPPV